MADIHEPEFQQKWGALFWSLKMRDKYDASFYFVFIIRRILYVLVAFSMIGYS